MNMLTRSYIFILSLLIICNLITFHHAHRQTIVISDMHIGGPWFQTKQSRHNLKHFLYDLARTDSKVRGSGGPPLTNIIINGDFFEFWLDKVDEMPIKNTELFTSTDRYGADVKKIIQALRSASDYNSARIILTQGNHDNEISQSDLEFLKNEYALDRLFYRQEYSDTGVRFEHGHKRDFFNAPHPDGIRPIGYYMARAAITSGVKSAPEVFTKICSVVPFFIGSLATGTWGDILHVSAIKKAFGDYPINGTTVFKGGCFWGSCGQCDVSVDLANKKYSHLRTRYTQSISSGEVNDMVVASCDKYERILKRTINPKQDKIVVMGHTHIPSIEQWTSKAGPDFLYVNTGSWIDNSTYDYVKIYYRYEETIGEEIAYLVERYQYNDTSPYLVESVNTAALYSEENLSKKSFRNINQVTVPPEWTCKPELYANGKSCYCGCGTYDPDCDNAKLFEINNCPKVRGKFVSGCNNVTGQCMYEYTDAPDGWTCDKSFWNANDGCDCNCGTAIDPDCKGSNICNCNKSSLLAFSVGLIAVVSILISSLV